MDENTAFTIGREWLGKLQASDERLPAVAATLQRIAAEPQAQAVATDGRLALVAQNELWIVTADLETEDVTMVTIQRVDLSDERLRLSLTESHGLDSDTQYVIYTWRADLELGYEPLDFRAEGLYERGHLRIREGHDPALAFGWQLAEAVGWSKPS